METLSKTLQDELKKQSAAGSTNKEMADRAGCSQQRINQLLNQGGFEKVKLETLLKLFPGMRITLGGTDITATYSAVNAGVNNGSMTIHAAGEENKIKSSLRSAILKSDGICDACKVKILTLLETV